MLMLSVLGRRCAPCLGPLTLAVPCVVDTDMIYISCAGIVAGLTCSLKASLRWYGHWNTVFQVVAVAHSIDGTALGVCTRCNLGTRCSSGTAQTARYMPCTANHVYKCWCTCLQLWQITSGKACNSRSCRSSRIAAICDSVAACSRVTISAAAPRPTMPSTFSVPARLPCSCITRRSCIITHGDRPQNRTCCICCADRCQALHFLSKIAGAIGHEQRR